MTHAFYRFGHSLPEEQATVHADLSVAKPPCHIDQTRFPEHLLGFTVHSKVCLTFYKQFKVSQDLLPITSNILRSNFEAKFVGFCRLLQCNNQIT